ncbi:hypothetical protein F2Q69_00006714 [Brassica cretica]|uniref:Uncharacterized protein n=1 Tax=Brassica cretica TaxID=69181 RepID=A0A8S9P560_BRACR|nr:hypothetical protein F2Q69_00006714 [Brassica cretica]
MMTPIEMKQKQVQSDRKGGNYEDGPTCPTRQTGELDDLLDPTRQMGKLDGLLDPTRPFGELDGAFGSTRPFGELDGAFGPTRRRDELDDLLFHCSGSVCLRPVVTFLEDLSSECDKIRDAPCEGCLRTLVIKPFVVRPGVEILKTFFPREDYELSSRNLTLCTALSVICFESFPQVFDTMPRDVRDQRVGFRERPRSNHGFRGCDDYFDLRFRYRFQPDSVPL